MVSENLIPIADLFEAHLTVSDLDRAVAFYGEQPGLPLARVFPERKVAFFWVGAPGRAMLGLLSWSDWVRRNEDPAVCQV